MLKRLLLTFNIILFYFLTTVTIKADLINPSSSIKPKEVIQIQLKGLMKNDVFFKDSGIEQTWNFAHPENKKNTCLLYTSPSPRDATLSRMPSSA